MPRPRQPGMTENELEVMQILWKQAPLKVADILEHIKREPKPAYTSLMTLVQSMERKSYLKSLKEDKAYLYSPNIPEKKFMATEVKRTAKRLFGGSPGDLVLNLVQNEQLNKSELEALKKLLKEI